MKKTLLIASALLFLTVAAPAFAWGKGSGGGNQGGGTHVNQNKGENQNKGGNQSQGKQQNCGCQPKPQPKPQPQPCNCEVKPTEKKQQPEQKPEEKHKIVKTECNEHCQSHGKPPQNCNCVVPPVVVPPVTSCDVFGTCGQPPQPPVVTPPLVCDENSKSAEAQAFISQAIWGGTPNGNDIVAFYATGIHTIPQEESDIHQGIDLIMADCQPGNFVQLFYGTSDNEPQAHGDLTVWQVAPNGSSCPADWETIPNASDQWGDYLTPGATYCAKTTDFSTTDFSSINLTDPALTLF